MPELPRERTSLFAPLRFVVADIDLVLGDYYSGLPEDHVKATPAYSRLTSLIYLDMDGEVTCTPEQLVERAQAYGDGPEPPTPQEMGELLPPREERNLRLHPAFARCLSLYQNAVIDWHGSDVVQDAARTLGMNARAYADFRLTATQFSWTSNRTSDPWTQEHVDLAYQDAVNEVCGVPS